MKNIKPKPFDLKSIFSIPCDLVWEEIGRDTLIANLTEKPYCLVDIMFTYSNFQEKYLQLILEKLGCVTITFQKGFYSRKFQHKLAFVNIHNDHVYVEFHQPYVDISIFSDRPDIKSVYHERFEELKNIFKPEPTKVEIPWRCFLTPVSGRAFRMTLSMSRDYNADIPLENYEEKTRYDLIKLEAAATNEQNNGKIIILEGPPGTGKSFYVRRLVNILSQANAIKEVLYYLGRGVEALELQHCLEKRVLLMEDADHILATSGSRNADIAKILNFSSGFIETSALFIFTSNLPISEIDPAFIRDGRLLAHIRFNCFDRAMANHWLRCHDCGNELDNGEYPLANLYSLSKQSVKIQNGFRRKAMGFIS